MVTCIMLIAGILFVLQFKPVQTFLGQKAAAYLSSELKTRVEIRGLYVRPFKSLVLEGLYIQDLQKDTLLYANELVLNINQLSIKKRKIVLRKVGLQNTQIYLKQYPNKTTNISFILTYFNKGPKTESKPFDITLKKIVLDNIAFKYKNFGDTAKVDGINFEDVALNKLSVTILDLDLSKHIVQAQFNKLTFREKSGFFLKDLTTLATIDSNQMEFKNLHLETPQSKLEDYFLMKFHSMSDFGDFTSKVYMSANFKNARLHSRDIAYFASALNKMDLGLDINGKINGKVNNLKTKSLAIKAGKTTFLKGNFDIKGLPEIDQTFLDLDLQQAYTNKQDLDYIIEKFTGKKDKVIPAIIGKLGNANFKGRFTGFTNDFVAFGEFKTQLGLVTSDLNMKLGKNSTSQYSGAVKVQDLDIGTLLDQKTLGRVSLQANIKGKNFDPKTLEEKANGKIHYIDLNGYRYNNITLDGSYKNKEFDGKLVIDDNNLNLSFQGSVNLKPQLPVFNFTSSIAKANLKELHLYKDTLNVSAEITSNFSGKNLNNIQGSLDVTELTLANTRQAMVVDTISLRAQGIGNSRSLVLKSDIADADLRGDYDLNSLPAYFLTVVKKYIPSFQTKYNKPSKPQTFDLSLSLKNFEPVRAIFIPTLRIPNGAILNGKFSSNENLATITAYVKQIQYNKIKVHELVLDENTNPGQLDIFISANRVDFTDSLFVKNVNISNILRNDSLHLNIKLSDKTAYNQLDLNGLVEFNSTGSSKTKLTLLPSEVVINQEVWKIYEKVAFNFDQNKIAVKDFGLTRNEQIISVNGIISSDPKDELIIGFNKFQLTTLNPLTKAKGFYSTGELNGKAVLYNLKNKPKVRADIHIDSLTCNRIYIGDLDLETGVDQGTNLATIKGYINKHGIKTAQVNGQYAIDKNDMDVDIQLVKNPVVLIQPFVSDLISDLSGDISANIKLRGKASKPQIQGTLSLEEVGLTVNYLKTHYQISNEINIKDNIISLSNFVIRDRNNHQAIAQAGTIDLREFDDPKLNISLSANEFMVLNTTSKDNQMYYGTAYSSGTFSFNGPLDNLSIQIKARTEEGTVFNIPLNSSERVGEKSFISFTKKDSTLNQKPERRSSGMSLNFDLDVTEQAEANIYTSIGKLSARGNSNLNLKINRFGDFQMFGDYALTQGKFRYSMKNLIEKIFEIKSGGTIRWTGDPTNATINLKAVYSARASVKPLYLAAGREPKDQRVYSEAILSLSGDLQTPEPTFKLYFPNDPYVNEELQSYLSDVSNTTTQALSLILQRSFIAFNGTSSASDNSSSNPNARSATTKIATEMAVNRVTDILSSSLNLQFVDFSIRPEEDYSASIRLLNDRLILTGIYTDRSSSSDPQNPNSTTAVANNNAINSPLAGEARYLIKKDGSLAATVSNKPPQLTTLTDFNVLNMQNISAVGLMYSREFDSFFDFKLLRFLTGKHRKADRQNKSN